jgi:hypothetical protein
MLYPNDSADLVYVATVGIPGLSSQTVQIHCALLQDRIQSGEVGSRLTDHMTHLLRGPRTQVQGPLRHMPPLI